MSTHSVDFMSLKNSKEMRFLLVLALLFFITFTTNKTASMNNAVQLGFPLVGITGITMLGGLLCLYVFFVSRKAFFFSKSTRILLLSTAFLLMALFLVEIAVVTILFRFSGTELSLGILDAGALASGVVLVLAAICGKKEEKKSVFMKYALVATCAWLLLSLMAFSVLYPAELHRYMLAAGGMLFILAGLLFGRLYASSANSVVLYYCAGFLILGNGLFSIAVSETFGDLITWFGLFTALLGFLMFVIPLKTSEEKGKQALRLPHVYTSKK